ncbi:hypothetical protein Poly41_64520 [Novipirellula artificiosorum]|uniref:Uncharacterized protein n=1 Tax=Novipirellula artificiosorum TaxID=2528016 RepID=A0A5C6D1D3_9BACT|nr:hypothetical protein Poly41_64520 [Novipirellula artificiosorum]
MEAYKKGQRLLSTWHIKDVSPSGEQTASQAELMHEWTVKCKPASWNVVDFARSLSEYLIY